MPANPLDSLKASFSALSGNITRQVRRYDNIRTLAPTPATMAQVKKFLLSAENSYSQLEDTYLQIVELDPALLEQFQTKVNNDADRLDALAQGVDALLSAGVPAPAPPVAAPPPPVPPAQQIKVIQDLKPAKLTLDNTPAEFHLWSEAFKAYFSASRLDRLDPGDQHAFVFACLDADLHKRIRPNILATTPVFADDGDDSVLGFLNDVFAHRYPLVQRRFDFFQYPHAAGQLASAWMSELRMRGDIADLADLTVDELYAYRIITGVQDSDLQDELLKLQNPTYKDVEAAVLLYEAKLSTKAKTSVNRMQSGSRSFRGRGPSASTSDAPSRGSASRSLCARCNRSHRGRPCAYPSSVTCHQCGRQGHISPACRSTVARAVLEEATVSTSSLEMPDTSASTLVRSLKSDNQPTPRLNLAFRQDSIAFSFLALPDTGATRTIIGEKLVLRYGLTVDVCSQFIMVANGERIRCAGSVLLSASFEDVHATINALVSPDVPADIFVSWHDLKALKILHDEFPLPILRAISSPILNKLFESYSDVISDTLGTRCLKGSPMTIHLRTDIDIRPFKIYTTKQVPLHLQAEADAAVQRALDDGVICPESEPTDWCCRGGFVPKPNGKLRLITDFIPLNKYILRPVHPFPSAFDIIQSIMPDSKVFAVLDCTMGYFQVPLSEESSKLTTFLLPQGRFRYKRAPMGLSASSDEFCRRSDQAIEGLNGVHKLVDDILIQAPSTEILFDRLTQLLERCRYHGLTLSQRKAQFALMPDDPPVKFGGYLISEQGVQPDPAKISALKEFPKPESATSLRSFLGLANQLGFFIPDLAHFTAKMRLLLKKGVAYVWNTDMDIDFNNIKAALTSDMVVHPFDPCLKTQLLTDASRVGLGFALLQIDVDGKPRLIQCGSRSLIPAESRYAIIELECLAVLYAMSKCDYYLRGMTSFQLITDHRPLVGIFEKCLPDIGNPRIQRFREKIAMYNFDVIWVAGKTNNIADALSRAPYFPPEGHDHPILASFLTDDIRLSHMAKIAATDSAYNSIIQALLDDIRLSSLPQCHPARSFANMWPRLSVSQGLLLLDGHRLVPPASQYQEILQKLHTSHSGIVRTRKLAQQLYYWPGMNNQIKLMVESCSVCQMLQPSQPNEPQIHTQSTFPMQDVSVDPFEYGGGHYLLMADRFSGYVWVEKLLSQDTKAVLKILTAWFLDYGFPLNLRSDGGPQFRSEFDAYCAEFGIVHDTSSPLYPVANGHAEANVKSVKYLLIKCIAAKENYRLALMEFRNTPRGDGYSPAQLYFGRRQRTLLPFVPEQLAVPVDVEAGFVAREEAHVAKQGGSHGKILTVLSPGQTILVQDAKSKRWQQRGKILSLTKTGRSYRLRLSNGKVLWRNRKYLRPVPNSLSLSAAPSSTVHPLPLTSPPLPLTFPAATDPTSPVRTLRPKARKNYREARPYRKNSRRN